MILYIFRSSDGRILVVSSLDGYCSIISFKDGELGKASEIDPMEYVSNKLKAKREAKKEVMKEKQKDQPERENTIYLHPCFPPYLISLYGLGNCLAASLLFRYQSNNIVKCFVE